MSKRWQLFCELSCVADGVCRAVPRWSGAVPTCSESCPHNDGKRCALLGARTPGLCEPVVAEMGAALERREKRFRAPGMPRCQCQWEPGDSPCTTHGEGEETC